MARKSQNDHTVRTLQTTHKALLHCAAYFFLCYIEIKTLTDVRFACTIYLLVFNLYANPLKKTYSTKAHLIGDILVSTVTCL